MSASSIRSIRSWSSCRRGSSEAVIDAKRREADNLRNRFVSCNEGLKLARAVRDVAVREPITRSSADLSPQLRDLLGSMRDRPADDAGRHAAGSADVRALRQKAEQYQLSGARRKCATQIFSKRFEAESKKYLEEMRKQAMIEYK